MVITSAVVMGWELETQRENVGSLIALGHGMLLGFGLLGPLNLNRKVT